MTQEPAIDYTACQMIRNGSNAIGVDVYLRMLFSYSMRRKAYLRFYSKPGRMWNLMKKMGRPAHAKQIGKAVFRRLFKNGETTVT